MSIEKFILDFLQGIGSIDFNSVLQVSGFAYLVFWLIVVAWVWVDSGERTSNVGLRIISTFVVAVLNVVGLLIYFFVRPRQTVEEIYWADLERRYLKYETAGLGDCPRCRYQLQPGFVNCPQCALELKTKCTSCEIMIEKDWRNCPYCGTTNSSFQKIVEKKQSRGEMDEKIKETKEEATEKVESKKTRYAFRSGFAHEVMNRVGSVAEGLGDILLAPMRVSKDKKSKKK